MGEVKSLIQKVRDGEIDPKEAVEVSEDTFTSIGDVDILLGERPLKCGFATIENYAYLREKSPDLVILAARPGQGKTALACQISWGVSKHSTVALFSLEMNKEQLKTRMIAGEVDTNIKRLNTADPAKLHHALELFKTVPLMIDDSNGLHIDALVHRALELHRKKPLGLVVVDYLQIVTVHNKRSKAEEIEYVTERLKGLAQQIGAPVLALAQMNREIEKRRADNPTAAPVMSDLMGSSGIERWADVILCLERDAHNENLAQVYALKNRHGESKDFKMGFSGTIVKFFDNGKKFYDPSI